MQTLNTILFISKKLSYRKQIARQHSCLTGLKTFPHIFFHHRAKIGCCFSYCVRACRRSQNFEGRRGHAPLREGVADPLKHVTSHLCYHTKFCRSITPFRRR